MNEKQGCFTLLVFSANFGFGRNCKKFYSVLFQMILTKENKNNV